MSTIVIGLLLRKTTTRCRCKPLPGRSRVALLDQMPDLHTFGPVAAKFLVLNGHVVAENEIIY